MKANTNSNATESYLTSPMIRKLQNAVRADDKTECASYR